MRPVVIVVVLVFAWACGGSTSAPSPTTSRNAMPFTGIWVGTYRYTGCDGLRDCFITRGRTASFTLRLEQAGGDVKGFFETRDFVIPVAGVSDASGHVILTGSAAAASAVDDYGTVQVSNFTLALDPTLGLAGSVEYTTSGKGVFSTSANVISWAATIVSASQRPLSDLAGWTGTWRGRFVVRACTYVGWASCYPEQADYVSPFTLTITDAGGVSGRLTLPSRVVPVTTLTIGSSLSLTGELSTPQSGGHGPEVTRIQEFNATSDQFGRLIGRFHYTDEWNGYSSTYDAELWQVVKQP